MEMREQQSQAIKNINAIERHWECIMDGESSRVRRLCDGAVNLALNHGNTDSEIAESSQRSIPLPEAMKVTTEVLYEQPRRMRRPKIVIFDAGAINSRGEVDTETQFEQELQACSGKLTSPQLNAGEDCKIRLDQRILEGLKSPERHYPWHPLADGWDLSKPIEVLLESAQKFYPMANASFSIWSYDSASDELMPVSSVGDAFADCTQVRSLRTCGVVSELVELHGLSELSVNHQWFHRSPQERVLIAKIPSPPGTTDMLFLVCAFGRPQGFQGPMAENDRVGTERAILPMAQKLSQIIDRLQEQKLAAASVCLIEPGDKRSGAPLTTLRPWLEQIKEATSAESVSLFVPELEVTPTNTDQGSERSELLSAVARVLGQEANEGEVVSSRQSSLTGPSVQESEQAAHILEKDRKVLVCSVYLENGQRGFVRLARSRESRPFTGFDVGMTEQICSAVRLRQSD